MRFPVGPTLVLVAASLLAAPIARAEAPRDPAHLVVTGDATVSTPPDRAEIEIGVETRAERSQQAVADNAAKMTRVVDAVRGAAGTAKVETSRYTLQPEYTTPSSGHERTLAGYTASNVVHVTLDRLADVSPVIGAATAAGANQVQRIQFTVKREDVVRARALRLAALQARAKARALAETLGLDVSRIASVEETSAPPRPMYERAIARTAGAATPILGGEIETHATVTMTVDVEPAP